MMICVAFLRGINSGKNPTVKMETVRKVFADLGFRNITTVLASGNVVFEADQTDKNALAESLERALSLALSYNVAVIIRTKDELTRLVKSNPFKDVMVIPQTRLYVTLLKGSLKPSLKLPYHNKEKGYTILEIVDNAICSVVDLSAGTTPDLMSALDKEFGKNLTTRNWNTIKKILATT